MRNCLIKLINIFVRKKWCQEQRSSVNLFVKDLLRYCIVSHHIVSHHIALLCIIPICIVLYQVASYGIVLYKLKNRNHKIDLNTINLILIYLVFRTRLKAIAPNRYTLYVSSNVLVARRTSKKKDFFYYSFVSLYPLHLSFIRMARTSSIHLISHQRYIAVFLSQILLYNLTFKCLN